MDDYYSQKRWTIIIHKHVIYEVSKELPNDLRLRN